MYNAATLGEIVWLRRKDSLVFARRNVSDDWNAALPREKAQLFQTVVRSWESSHAMLSVALDEALSLRARGEVVCSRQQISVTADLLQRLASSLTSCCVALGSGARQIVRLPAVEPLKTEFFRGSTAQTAASWNGIVHHILFGDRSRFFHKLRMLSDTVHRLDREFADAAEDICAGVPRRASSNFGTLDCLHYDFSTCLRETEVMLKSFLRALPDEQLAAFTIALETPSASRSVRPSQKLSRVSA